MSSRELVVLGTSSAVPTKSRNHNGYLLRWDGYGVLFDPGEGTQRQMAYAGVSAHDVDAICLTHFHGDHCLGVPGVVQRIARDGVAGPVRAVYPRSGEEYWRRLRHAAIFNDTQVIVERPVSGDAMTMPDGDAPFRLTARRLDHRVESYGYRLEEPDGVTLLPDRLAAYGIAGPLAGRLQREGRVTAPDGRTVTVGECGVPRPGQKVAFVMDTRLCAAIGPLAEGVDLLVIESTFLDTDAKPAQEYGHLTAGQAGRVAAEAGVRRLVLTHFSERYGAEEEPRFAEEAAAAFRTGDIVTAHDLLRVPVPPRHRPGVAPLPRFRP